MQSLPDHSLVEDQTEYISTDIELSIGGLQREADREKGSCQPSASPIASQLAKPGPLCPQEPALVTREDTCVYGSVSLTHFPPFKRRFEVLKVDIFSNDFFDKKVRIFTF